MIRIDLGKSERPSAKASKPNPLSDLLAKANRSLHEELGGYLAIGVAAAFACLPYLFVDQYRSFSEKNHLAQMKTLSETEEGLNQEIQRYSSFQRELESYEQQKKNTAARLEVIRALIASRATPVNVLDAVSLSLPSRTWLKSVELQTGKDAQLKLSGLSYSNEEVSDFAEKLSESIYLSNVSLDEVSGGVGNGDDQVRGFSLKAFPNGLDVEEPGRTVASEGGAAQATNVQPGKP